MKIGQEAKDIITGFRGTITGIVEYLTGCKQALVQPRMDKKKQEFQEARWFDVDRLKITNEAALSLSITANGPDSPAPRK